jgi:hypothetical protein
VPHQANLWTRFSDSLAQALDAISKERGWAMTDTYDQAINAFYNAWYAGQTSHRYQGFPPDVRERTLWVSRTASQAIRRIAKAERMSGAVVAHEALRWYCEQQGYPVTFSYPQPQETASDSASD